MANDYYELQEADKALSSSVARSSKENGRMLGVEAGFDKLPTLETLSNSNQSLGTDSGAANAYVITRNVTLLSLVDGVPAIFKALNNNTGASTANVDGTGVKAIIWPDGSSLLLDDITAGSFYGIRYNGTAYELEVGSVGLFTRANNEAIAAAASASAALVSEGNAATSETNAAGSASAAATSASNALTSETNASASETNAVTSAANALTSENNASTSETNAGASAAAALVSEGNASTSETNAGVSETNAAASASAAATSATSATSSANFKGLWTALSGALNVPATVEHVGLNWQLLTNLADVTLSEPGVTGDWSQVPIGINRVADDTVIANTTWNDTFAVNLGTGNDFTMLNNGAALTLFQMGSGSWNLRNSSAQDIFGASQTSAFMMDSGSVKLNTTSSGISVTGDVSIPDSGEILLGAGNDFSMKFDGSDTRFRMFAGTWTLQNSSEQNIISADQTTAYLRHSGSIKLNTLSDGANCTGDLKENGVALDMKYAPIAAVSDVSSTGTAATGRNILERIAATSVFARTLSSSPTDGDIYEYRITSGDPATNNITITAPAAAKIRGFDDWVITLDDSSNVFKYKSSTNEWI